MAGCCVRANGHSNSIKARIFQEERLLASQERAVFHRGSCASFVRTKMIFTWQRSAVSFITITRVNWNVITCSGNEKWRHGFLSYVSFTVGAETPYGLQFKAVVCLCGASQYSNHCISFVLLLHWRVRVRFQVREDMKESRTRFRPSVPSCQHLASRTAFRNFRSCNNRPWRERKCGIRDVILRVGQVANKKQLQSANSWKGERENCS